MKPKPQEKAPFLTKQNRNTIFSGKFKLYEKEFTRDMANVGDKIGPGPATVNIRDFRPVPKKANNLPKSRRHIGEPNPSWAAPGQYHQDTQQK